ncbi:MAG: hypothetical protein AAB466_02390 [Verrucomicrobiota bacterium]
MNKRPHSCNVLEFSPTARRLWHFAAHDGQVALTAEHQTVPPDLLPAKYVGKDWRNLWQRKLNIVWLPSDQVFLRVVQLPASDFQEVLSMVEFQLEKLSPLPVTQIVWSVEVLPSQVENSQTVIVVIAARSLVEEYLGTLEGEGCLADRLELPFLPQLLSSQIKEDGAWIYPQIESDKTVCWVAWWYGGTLQNLQLLNLPNTDNRAVLLEEQLLKTAWAGEMEGWLTFPVSWHLVADRSTAALWEPWLGQWAGASITLQEALSRRALAELAAQRAVSGDSQANLLPAEHASRYRQQFFDRLWMRGLGAVMAVYLVGLLIYFGALQVLRFQQFRVDKELDARTGSYTNALQLKERVQVLQDQLNLKYAALDCWKVASELLPPDLTLTWLIFGKGINNQALTLHGIAPPDQASKLTDYNQALRDAAANGQPLFRNVLPPTSRSQGGPSGAAMISWSFQCDVNRTDLE